MSEDRITNLEIEHAKLVVETEYAHHIITKLENSIDAITLTVNNARGFTSGARAVLAASMVILGYFCNDRVNQYNAINDDQYKQIVSLQEKVNILNDTVVKMQYMKGKK